MKITRYVIANFIIWPFIFILATLLFDAHSQSQYNIFDKFGEARMHEEDKTILRTLGDESWRGDCGGEGYFHYDEDDIFPSRTGCFNPEERFAYNAVTVDTGTDSYVRPVRGHGGSLDTELSCGGGITCNTISTGAYPGMPRDDLLLLNPTCINEDEALEAGNLLTQRSDDGEHAHQFVCQFNDYIDDFDNFCEFFSNADPRAVDNPEFATAYTNEYWFVSNNCWTKYEIPDFFVEQTWEHWLPLGITDHRNSFPSTGTFDLVSKKDLYGDYGFRRYEHENSTPEDANLIGFDWTEHLAKDWEFNTDYGINKGNVYNIIEAFGANTPIKEMMNNINFVGVKNKRQQCLKVYIEEWAHRGDCGEIVLRGAPPHLDTSYCQWVTKYDAEQDFYGSMHNRRVDPRTGLPMEMGMRNEFFDYINFNVAGGVSRLGDGYDIDDDNANICKLPIKKGGLPKFSSTRGTPYTLAYDEDADPADPDFPERALATDGLDFSKRGCPTVAGPELWPNIFRPCRHYMGAERINDTCNRGANAAPLGVSDPCQKSSAIASGAGISNFSGDIYFDPIHHAFRDRWNVAVSPVSALTDIYNDPDETWRYDVRTNKYLTTDIHGSASNRITEPSEFIVPTSIYQVMMPGNDGPTRLIRENGWDLKSGGPKLWPTYISDPALGTYIINPDDTLWETKRIKELYQELKGDDRHDDWVDFSWPARHCINFVDESPPSCDPTCEYLDPATNSCHPVLVAAPNTVPAGCPPLLPCDLTCEQRVGYLCQDLLPPARPPEPTCPDLGTCLCSDIRDCLIFPPALGGVFTSCYGNRDFGSYPEHNGLDIAGAGVTVIAAGAGTITEISPPGFNCVNNTSCVFCAGDSYGNHIVIQLDHPWDRYQITYNHLQAGSLKPGVSVGAHVDAGAPLAEIGSSGCSSGAHLHYEIRSLDAPYTSPYWGKIDPVPSALIGNCATLNGQPDDAARLAGSLEAPYLPGRYPAVPSGGGCPVPSPSASPFPPSGDGDYFLQTADIPDPASASNVPGFKVWKSGMTFDYMYESNITSDLKEDMKDAAFWCEFEVPYNPYFIGKDDLRFIQGLKKKGGLVSDSSKIMYGMPVEMKYDDSNPSDGYQQHADKALRRINTPLTTPDNTDSQFNTDSPYPKPSNENIAVKSPGSYDKWREESIEVTMETNLKVGPTEFPVPEQLCNSVCEYPEDGTCLPLIPVPAGCPQPEPQSNVGGYQLIERIRDTCNPFSMRTNWKWDDKTKLSEFLLGHRNRRPAIAGILDSPLDNEAERYGRHTPKHVETNARCEGWKGLFEQQHKDIPILNWRLPRFDYEFLKAFIECTGPMQEKGPQVCHTFHEELFDFNTWNPDCGAPPGCFEKLFLEPDGTTSTAGVTYTGYHGFACVYTAVGWADPTTCGGEEYPPDLPSSPPSDYAPGRHWPPFFYEEYKEADPDDYYPHAGQFMLLGDNTPPKILDWEKRAGGGFWCRCDYDDGRTSACNENFCTCDQFIHEEAHNIDELKHPKGGSFSDVYSPMADDNPRTISNWHTICRDYGPFKRWLQCFYQARAKSCPVLTREVSSTISPSNVILPFEEDDGGGPVNIYAGNYGTESQGENQSLWGTVQVNTGPSGDFIDPFEQEYYAPFDPSNPYGASNRVCATTSVPTPHGPIASPLRDKYDAGGSHAGTPGSKEIVMMRWQANEPNILAKLPITADPGGVRTNSAGFVLSRSFKHPDLVFQSAVRSIEAPYMEIMIPFTWDLKSSPFDYLSDPPPTTLNTQKERMYERYRISPQKVAFTEGNKAKYVKALVAAEEAYRTPGTIDNRPVFNTPDDIHISDFRGPTANNPGDPIASSGSPLYGYYSDYTPSPRVQDVIVGPRGCDIGGWYEMMLYQARCIKLFRLNCMCDYDKTFAAGNAEAYVLQRSGMHIQAIGANLLLPGFGDQRDRKDFTFKISEVERSVPLLSRGFVSPNYPKPGPLALPSVTRNIGLLYPGDSRPEVNPYTPANPYYDNAGWTVPASGSFAPLDFAKPGDWVIWDESITEEDGVTNARYRRHVAYVEQISWDLTDVPGNEDRPDDGVYFSIDDPRYITVTEYNYGKHMDSCGNTDRWQYKTTRKIWNTVGAFNADANTFEEGAPEGRHCEDPDNRTCYERNWDRVRVYRPSLDNTYPRAFSSADDPDYTDYGYFTGQANVFPSRWTVERLDAAGIPPKMALRTLDARAISDAKPTSYDIGLFHRLRDGYHDAREVNEWLDEFAGILDPPMEFRRTAAVPKVSVRNLTSAAASPVECEDGFCPKGDRSGSGGGAGPSVGGPSTGIPPSPPWGFPGGTCRTDPSLPHCTQANLCTIDPGDPSCPQTCYDTGDPALCADICSIDPNNPNCDYLDCNNDPHGTTTHDCCTPSIRAGIGAGNETPDYALYCDAAIPCKNQYIATGAVSAFCCDNQAAIESTFPGFISSHPDMFDSCSATTGLPVCLIDYISDPVASPATTACCEEVSGNPAAPVTFIKSCISNSLLACESYANTGDFTGMPDICCNYMDYIPEATHEMAQYCSTLFGDCNATFNNLGTVSSECCGIIASMPDAPLNMVQACDAQLSCTNSVSINNPDPINPICCHISNYLDTPNSDIIEECVMDYSCVVKFNATTDDNGTVDPSDDIPGIVTPMCCSMLNLLQDVPPLMYEACETSYQCLDEFENDGTLSPACCNILNSIPEATPAMYAYCASDTALDCVGYFETYASMNPACCAMIEFIPGATPDMMAACATNYECVDDYEATGNVNPTCCGMLHQLPEVPDGMAQECAEQLSCTETYTVEGTVSDLCCQNILNFETLPAGMADACISHFSCEDYILDPDNTSAYCCTILSSIEKLGIPGFTASAISQMGNACGDVLDCSAIYAADDVVSPGCCQILPVYSGATGEMIDQCALDLGCAGVYPDGHIPPACCAVADAFEEVNATPAPWADSIDNSCPFDLCNVFCPAARIPDGNGGCMLDSNPPVCP